MTSYSALSPVSRGIYSRLSVAAVTDLATGGIGDDIEQGTGFPFVLYEVTDTAIGGLGTKPGVKHFSEIDLRVHVFSTYQGWSEAQEIMNEIIGLLADPVSVTGYGSWGIFHDATVTVPDQIVAAVKVKELVGMFRMYVEHGVPVAYQANAFQESAFQVSLVGG